MSEKDISTVGGLIDYLKTLPQEAEVWIADGETYRTNDDYQDWDEDDNARFPIEFVVEEREEDEPIVTLVGSR